MDKIYQEHYSDMPREEFDRRVAGRVNHENLDGPGVISAGTSHELQNIAPSVKPVVKGTKYEVLRMKMTGKIGPQKVVFTDGKDTAYIIDANAVQGIYGGSLVQAVNQAKKDLKNGGKMESLLLGYPDREGLSPGEKMTAAVDKSGKVLTDLNEMKEAGESGDLAWGAEGKPDDVIEHAKNVAEALSVPA